MPRAYSQDLRDRVIDAVTTGGMSRHAAARRFGISIASAIRWVRHFERSGSRTDRGTGGHQPSSVRRHREWLLALVEKEFSLTLRAMCERLQKERGVKADRSILSRFFRAEGITIKKTVLASKQNRPDVARKRTWFGPVAGGDAVIGCETPLHTDTGRPLDLLRFCAGM